MRQWRLGALRATSGRGLQPAMDYLFEHEGEPVPASGSGAGASGTGGGGIVIDIDDDDDADADADAGTVDVEAKVRRGPCPPMFVFVFMPSYRLFSLSSILGSSTNRASDVRCATRRSGIPP